MGGIEPAVLAEPRPVEARTDRRRAWILEAGLVALLALAVFAVHDVGYLLDHPFWLDEAWVALSTRAPIPDLPVVTSATPIGFTFLIRWVPGDAEQRYRLVPLLFSAGTVVAAYLLGRELRLTRITTGLLLGAGVLLSRAMLVRSDLKQYTAEAFMTVVLLLLLTRLETSWTRRRLVVLGAVGALGMLLAHTYAFTATAVMASLFVVTIARRAWDRLRELVVVAAVMFAGMGTIYLVFDRPHQIPVVTRYWRGWYLPIDRGPGAVWSYLHDRLPDLTAFVGTRQVWVIVLLALGGIATLVWLKRPALALAVPFMILLTMGASAFEKYPFAELRTSTFWLVPVVLLMFIAVANLARLAGRWHQAAGALVVIGALALTLVAANPSLRAHTNPSLFDEDVRSQVRYLDAHRTPEDVVIVNWAASYGFAYYARNLRPGFVSTKRVQMGYYPTLADTDNVILMRERRPSDVDNALARARRALGDRGGRIWIVRSHSSFTNESSRWEEQLKGKDVERIKVGPEELLLYRVPPATAS